ncbi:MAG: DUF1801 domain-containing protein [Trebonia sp.]
MSTPNYLTVTTTQRSQRPPRQASITPARRSLEALANEPAPLTEHPVRRAPCAARADGRSVRGCRPSIHAGTRDAGSASIPPAMGQFVASMRREMDVPEQVEAYLASQPKPKQADLRRLHAHILAEFPGCRLWFTDGTNADGKVVANPSIGYGACTITYADGSSREFYRIGLSANTTGISVYVLGLDDKTYLARTYGGSIGKASVTGYCIKFRHLAVINVDVLQAAIQYGMSVHQAG